MNKIIWIYGPIESDKTIIANTICMSCTGRTETLAFPFHKEQFLTKYCDPSVKVLLLDNFSKRGIAGRQLFKQVIQRMREIKPNKLVIITSQTPPPDEITSIVLQLQTV